jgi:predicted RND superfamily exporter protein
MKAPDGADSGESVPGGSPRFEGPRRTPPVPADRWTVVLLRRLAHAQATRPFTFLFFAAWLVALALFLASKMELETGFEPLLPDGRASVEELHRVAKKTSGVSTLFIVLEVPADGPPAVNELRAAGDALTDELRKIGEPYVGSADDGLKDAVAFVEPRAGLYADLADLEGLQHDIDARWEYEVLKGTGQLLDDTEPPPPLSEETIRKRLHLDEKVAADRYPDGYFQSQDGRTLVVAVRSKVLGSDVEQGTIALQKARDAVARVDLSKYHPKMTYGLAGDLYSGVVEASAAEKDLLDVGILGASLIAGVVLLFYLRIRTLAVMLATIGIGIAWTAGCAHLVVKNLNMATGFVFTIIAGNGLNASVIYMARYLEDRRDGSSLEEGIFTAHKETIVATFAAVATSSASFASLTVTGFRGFRELGQVGAIGLLLCWTAMVVCLPALLAVTERLAPIAFDQKAGLLARIRASWAGAFGKPFAWLVPKAPRAIATIGVALALAGLVGLVVYVESDPMEYDLGHLRNDREARATEEHYKKLAPDITGYVGADGMAMLVDRTDQVGPLRDALYKIRDAAPADQKPFSMLFALEDLVPKDQEKKIPVLLDIAKKLTKMHKRHGIDDAAWAKVERFIPPADLQPFAMADLPEGMARNFTETDGTRGRIVYIVPTAGDKTEDARYLLRWAASYRETKLPDGSVVLGSGRAVIYADRWSAVLSAVPIAALASIVAVVMVVVISFRRGRSTLYVLAALAVGVGWMAGTLVLFKLKLNFLNFVAIPITFGIGVEYAVNIVYRYEREGRGGAIKAMRETGGAVVLCSMTTILGYVALAGSMNFAIRSLGYVAVLGEICTLLAAMLVLPAALVWIDKPKIVTEKAGAKPPELGS